MKPEDGALEFPEQQLRVATLTNKGTYLYASREVARTIDRVIGLRLPPDPLSAATVRGKSWNATLSYFSSTSGGRADSNEKWYYAPASRIYPRRPCPHNGVGLYSASSDTHAVTFPGSNTGT